MPDARRSEDLREQMIFQRRGSGDDGFGNTLPGAGVFVDQFTVWAHLRPLRGTESVMQSRLQGRQPYVITVRQSSQTRTVDPTWQVVDKNNPSRVFAITALPTDPDGRRAWHEFLVVEGGHS